MSHDNLSATSTSIPPDPTELLEKFRELTSSAYQQHDAAAVHIRAMALIGRLKSVHRASNTATRARKEETAAARQEMDQSHLNLQNLLYEKRHLEREIEKCRQFASVPFVVYKSKIIV
jgi:THO complex subunit 5